MEAVVKVPLRAICICLALIWLLGGAAVGQPLTPVEQLGKSLLFDQNLSTPRGQPCVTCHGAAVGFTGPISEVNAHGSVYPGAIARRFGNRKPPSAAYAGASPVLRFDPVAGVWIGGVFWDGHATGWTLGDPLAEQALRPFLNPLEQNNPDRKIVVQGVARSQYATLFRQVWGSESLPRTGVQPPLQVPFNYDVAYERIGRSIAAYERSNEVNPFTSKYDFYLAGQVILTPQEALGLQLFNSRAKCVICHPSAPGPGGQPPTFTDFKYHNLGVPKNSENPFYKMPPLFNPDGENFVDTGLGGFLKRAGFPPEVYEREMGKQKVPTLRNVDLRPSEAFAKAYTHNGFFKSLEDIVHFYNTRDVFFWPPPEVTDNLSATIGNLGLAPDEEEALVAFLKTLSDGFVP